METVVSSSCLLTNDSFFKAETDELINYLPLHARIGEGLDKYVTKLPSEVY